MATPEGSRVAVAGVVLVRQRPSTAGGIVFMTLEDETGIANLVLKPKVYRRRRRVARHEAACVAIGRIERRGDVVHLVVSRLEPIPGEPDSSTRAASSSEPEGAGRASPDGAAPWRRGSRDFR